MFTDFRIKSLSENTPFVLGILDSFTYVCCHSRKYSDFSIISVMADIQNDNDDVSDGFH